MHATRSRHTGTETDLVVYCTRCRGVVPFRPVGPRGRARRLLEAPSSATARLECGRCGTRFAMFDPSAALRRRARRYLLYAAASGGLVALAGLAVALLGAGHPLAGEPGVRLGCWGLGAMALACFGRFLRLSDDAARYESLEDHELRELGRRLCPGMIRSDVVEELSRRGWRPGKIRSVLGGLRPA